MAKESNRDCETRILGNIWDTLKKRKTLLSLPTSLEDEINVYKKLPGIPLLRELPVDKTKYNNPLEWWANNHGRFPLLSHAARQVHYVLSC